MTRGSTRTPLLRAARSACTTQIVVGYEIDVHFKYALNPKTKLWVGWSHFFAGDYVEALDQCMAILQTDRKFRDDAGRTTMIRIMATMGKGSDVAQRYRRRMFAFLH